MKHVLTLLSVVFLVGLMVDAASAATPLPTKKNNVTLCVLNTTVRNAAVILNPKRDLETYLEDLANREPGDPNSLFRRDGGQFINQGATGEFKTKAGDNRIVAVDVVRLDNIAEEEFYIEKGSKKVYAQVVGDQENEIPWGIEFDQNLDQQL